MLKEFYPVVRARLRKHKDTRLLLHVYGKALLLAYTVVHVSRAILIKILTELQVELSASDVDELHQELLVYFGLIGRCRNVKRWRPRGATHTTDGTSRSSSRRGFDENDERKPNPFQASSNRELEDAICRSPMLVNVLCLSVTSHYQLPLPNPVTNGTQNLRHAKTIDQKGENEKKDSRRSALFSDAWNATIRVNGRSQNIVRYNRSTAIRAENVLRNQ